MTVKSIDRPTVILVEGTEIPFPETHHISMPVSLSLVERARMRGINLVLPSITENMENTEKTNA